MVWDDIRDKGKTYANCCTSDCISLEVFGSLGC